MLVLSRRKDESIVLPDLGVSIKVLKCSGNQIRLGIEAPSDVRILRGELAEVEQWSDDPLEHVVPIRSELLAAM